MPTARRAWLATMDAAAEGPRDLSTRLATHVINGGCLGVTKGHARPHAIDSRVSLMAVGSTVRARRAGSSIEQAATDTNRDRSPASENGEDRVHVAPLAAVADCNGTSFPHGGCGDWRMEGRGRRISRQRDHSRRPANKPACVGGIGIPLCRSHKAGQVIDMGMEDAD